MRRVGWLSSKFDFILVGGGGRRLGLKWTKLEECCAALWTSLVDFENLETDTKPRSPYQALNGYQYPALNLASELDFNYLWYVSP